MKVRSQSVFALLVCSLLVAGGAFAASPDVVISQVYGAGGNSGAVLNADYIELFNRGGAPVSLAGWSLQYASATGTGNFGSGATLLTELPAVTLQPGQYFLVKQAGGATGAPFTADYTDPTPIAMAATAGKVALAKVAVSLGCNGSSTPCSAAQLANIVDLVGYGSANFFEGSGPTPAPSTSNAVFRKSNGCQDTDNNAADFAAGPAAVRTSASPATGCGNAAPAITAPANPAATVSQDAAPFTVALTGSDDNNIFNWSATAGSGVSSVAVSAGQGTGSVTYTVSLQSGFNGTASFTASLSDNVNAPVTRTVNLQVNPLVVNDPPSIVPPLNPIATVAQDAAPFAVSLTGADDNGVFNWSAAAGTGVSAVAVSTGQGTSAVTFTVTLQAGFSGTASFTASLSDGFNAAATQAVAITVTPAPPPPLDHMVISQIYGGGGNTGATFRNDYVELYNASTTPFDLGGWTIQYASSTGTTWQIAPLGGIVQPGQYYLVQLASGGANGSVLPSANVAADINMSGTTGKVALVMSGDPLSSGCPVGDPLLVDLVGYGTANCREGAANAPAPSNTTAAFRKNGGFTDTNVNSADFVTGVPNPRRTAPIVEIGPYVLTVDPRNNATTAPRDASLSVTFTEPVDADAGFFQIQCATSGTHTSATVATVGGSRTWIITPNDTFVAGELCTATIFKTAIHDQDFDDFGPNTDTLSANYSWSFTIATGTAPAYTADVHLTFGNPSAAEADLLQPNNYLMEKPEFTLSYNRDRGTANWVSWHLDQTWVGTLTRVDTFRPDPAVPAEWYRVLHTDYQSSGFDRGHMVPNADRDKETSIPINQATFLMTNMIPQSPDNNQGPWADMENDLRALIPANELYVVAGGAGTGGTGSNGPATTIAGGKVTVPAQTWKCALVLPAALGDDLSRVTGATRTICVIMPNVQGIRNDNWQNYLTTVNAVEALTGYDLFANLPNAVENAVEAGVNGANKPGVADSSVTTNEDTPATFTLDVAAANNNPLTYTIVSGPSNGTLSGTGANRTYTPAPDFHGTDSFTFQVSDGANVSNTGVVAITVHSVNDAPAASVTVTPTTTEGSTVTATVSVTDADHASHSYAWTVTKNGAPFAAGSSSSITFTADDNGNYGVSVTATDAAGGYGSASATVVASNVAPVAGSVSGPTAPVALGTPATISVTYTDAGTADTHTATVTWDDGSTSTVACGAGVCTASRTYAAAGVYGLTVVVADDDGGSAVATFSYIRVVNANETAAITGGGWLMTPSGRATTSVNAQYIKGAMAGNTQFKVAGYELKSTSYDWLIVSGNTAQLQGTGTVNGTGSYAFLITVADGDPDKLRIRVWDKATAATIYDNVPGGSDDLEAANPQALGGGNLTIH